MRATSIGAVKRDNSTPDIPLNPNVARDHDHEILRVLCSHRCPAATLPPGGEAEAAAGQGYGDLTSLHKSAYGGSSGGYGASSVPAPPCPKNYLFSCQPNLAPVPCSAPAPSYGSAGAYLSPVAAYAAPNYGVPQQQQLYGAYMPQAYGFQY
ncbi:vitelline membrane protein Vm26Aa-like [Drosophila innubila]|uniref:vitelline membrane protein Vm26Aa-like n=1 Tax=Drosophila innubila TaxID=198719 RepID=UPI00148C18FF|nr:vitelline membrane protein Vm26Aa-like [Drosophila innubila]